MRRIAVLVAVVAAAAGAVWRLEAPRARTPAELVRGTRVLRVSRAHVVGVAATIEGRGFTATRDDGGWRLDDVPASAGATEALDALVEMLARLRAIDAFRSTDVAQFGLAASADVVTVRTSRRTRRLVLGRYNASGSALYARREGDPRVLLVGAGLLSAIERVLWQREAMNGG